MSNIFSVKADDLHAAPLFEVALVKPSGYLNPVGVGALALKAAQDYSAAKGGRVVVTRTFGATDWEIFEQADAPEAFEIPDYLTALTAPDATTPLPNGLGWSVEADASKIPPVKGNIVTFNVPEDDDTK